jgi:hypothetical protein
VLERLYVHGTKVLHTRRCIALNSANTAIVDSYIDECHSNSGDSQAIYGWNGPGPFKIVNNYLAAGHEVVGFGGPTPGIKGLIPSDIEIRLNHITRPLSWKGVWTIKNLFEMKSGQRVIFEGNVLENNWMSAQPGFAILLQGVTDTNDAPQNRIWDVMIRNNIIRNTAAGVNLASRVAYPYAGSVARLPDEPMRRVSVVNNLIVIGGGPGGAFDGNMRMVQILNDARDVSFVNNTAVGARGAVGKTTIQFDGTTKTERLNFVQNVFGPTAYGVMGNGVNGMQKTLAQYAPDARVADNVFTGIPTAQQLTGNLFPATVAEAGLQAALSDSYRFAPVGVLANALGSKQLGANLDAITAATAGVVQP